MDRSWINHYDKEMTGAPESLDMTMYEVLVRTAKTFPDRTGVAFEGTHITYSELLDEVDSFADALADCNIGVGTVVTVCLPNIPQAVVSVYAINKLGAIGNMVHPKTPPKELRSCMERTNSECLLILDAFVEKNREMLEDLEPGLVIACSITDYLSLPKSIGFRLTKGRKIAKIPSGSFYITYKELIRHGDFIRSGKLEDEYDWASPFGDEVKKEDEPYIRPFEPDDPALYLHSGGTTGSSKVIQISSNNMNYLAGMGPQIMRFPDPFKNPKDHPELTMVAILPLFHGFGICMCMHCMVISAVNILLIPLFSPDNLAKAIKKEKPNLIAAVPTLYEGMMKSDKLKKMNLSFLRDCYCGGDTLSPDLKRRFEEFVHERGSKLSLREGFGLTETVTVCAVNPYEECRDGSVGLPLPGIDMMIARMGTDEEVPNGEKGEICVTGPTVMLGYLNDPEATAVAIHTHADGRRWVHTGDLGHRDEDGYFYFDQRIKRIIKVSGVPVFPTEIEKTMMEHPDVEVACAVAVPHPYRIHVVKAYVVLKDHTTEGASCDKVKEELQDLCKKSLIPYACPVDYEFRTDLPKTKVGKVDFRALMDEPKKEEYAGDE